ncbi:MAG: family 20 glycosylhydrolase [Odoribacter sp.]
MLKNFIILFVVCICCAKMPVSASVDIIPRPVKLIVQDGNFSFNEKCVIVVTSEIRVDGDHLADYLSPAMGFRLSVVEKVRKGQKAVYLSIDRKLAKISDEAYRLEVTEQDIRIQGATTKGVFYGIQSLLQLLPADIYRKNTCEANWLVPCVEMEDYPRFSWRGLSLDVSRQFYSLDFIKSCIDWLAMHKLNVFHWHLTDDEGWRIEIKKYPELTSVGGWRGPKEKVLPSFGSGYCRYGGYYTQDQVREVVKYAAERQVMIMPEIEVPGHSRAVAAAYPSILCDYIDTLKHKNPQNSWCAGNEHNYEMLGDILKEVAALFPCPYIHIGGDEVDMSYWENCRRCTQLKKQSGFQKTEEIQNYFIRRVEKLVEAAGKKMGGWCEIMYGGELEKGTAIFSWIDTKHGIDAARRGFPVVMMPGEYCYFDMGQTSLERGHWWAGLVPTEKAYSFNPLIPDSLKLEERKLVMGVEGGIWSEMLDRPAWYCEYQMFPRLCALAEVAWTPQEQREWGDFRHRLEKSHYMRLYESGIRFRVPFPEVKYQTEVLSAVLPYENAVVRYTSDGSEPTCFSSLYTDAISTATPERYRFRTFFTPNWGSISVGVEKSQVPAMSVSTNISAASGCQPELLTDGNDKTCFRSDRRVVDGDYVLFEFKEPLNCRKITVKSGMYQTTRYIISHGLVELSMDGKRFIKSGVFDMNGDSEIPCTVPVKALRITFTESQFEERLNLKDLFVE